MILWIALTTMIVIAAVGVTIPLVRRYDRSRQIQGVAGILVEQMDAIDVEEGHGEPDDVDSLRADVGRRLISEAPAAPPLSRPLSGRGLIALGLGLAAVVGVAATLIYAKIGRPDLAGARPLPAPPPSGADAVSPHQGMDPAMLIAQLEARMRQNPGDKDGWRMLGWSYMRTGRYADAAGAYRRASALAPSDGEFLSAEGEALTQAAGGQVTSGADAAFRGALARAADDPRARFFLALEKEQHGDHAAAMTEWIALLKSAPPGSPWAPDVRSAVLRIAAQHGEDVSAKLPGPPAGAAPVAAAPSGTEAEAVQQATPADQNAMIQGMVAKLDARLSANPRDPEGWIQLMRARMVLGDPAAAAAAYHRASGAYADSAAQQAAFESAAKDLRIPGL